MRSQLGAILLGGALLAAPALAQTSAQTSAQAPANPGAPEAALRLTPSFEPVAPAEPLRLPPVATPPVAAAPAPVPAAPITAPPAAQASAYGPRQLTFPGGVNATFDVTYANLRGFRPLTLDLYQPESRGMAMPLVVFVHGGGWNGGDTRQAAGFADFPRELANLAAQGYVVASVSYRLSGEARFPAAVQDVKSAIRWLRGRSRDLNVDITRVAVWGEGAGGQLAALTGVTCGVAPFEPPAAPGRQEGGEETASVCVQAVIDWYGATDLQNLAADNLGQPDAAGFKPVAAGEFQPPPSSDAGSFLGCEPALCPPMAARLASPLAFISATSPPFLIQHGEEDKVIAPRQSQRLHEALRKAGVPAELITYPNVGHNFSRQGVTDAAAQRAAMEKLISFLSATFPAIPLGTKVAQPRGSLY
jgi:acetyl esterase/lipase